jgi:hypothetical protein
MGMSLAGKGFTIWKAQECEHGNAQAIVRKAQSAGLSHVLIKVADGAQAYNASYLPAITGGLKAAGISVWGWQYIYGSSPIDEASAAVSAVNQHGLDGFVVNAGKEYEGKFGQATAYMQRLAAALKDTPRALTSFRAPEYHPSFPWTEFLSQCSLHMPQVFWANHHQPGRLLEQTIAQFKRVYPVVPIVPTGPACQENGWRPSPAEVQEFMAAAKDLGLDGVHFWNWDYAGGSQGSDLWQAVSRFDWSEQESTEDDPVSALFQALNRADVDGILKLYAPDGVLVTRQKTLRGPLELRDYYTNLLNAQFSRGQFIVEKHESRGDAEHVTWSGSTSSPAQRISGAQDTIGLRDGHIQYHTSLYQITP